ncbi:MAG: hypothetical protein P8130_03360, partial [Deltaproteobacteria bacterium]
PHPWPLKMVAVHGISFVFGLSAYLVYSGQTSFADLPHSATTFCPYYSGVKLLEYTSIHVDRYKKGKLITLICSRFGQIDSL